MKRAFLCVALASMMLLSGCSANIASVGALFGPDIVTTNFTDTGVTVNNGIQFSKMEDIKDNEDIVKKPTKVHNFEAETLLGTKLNQDVIKANQITMVYVWSVESEDCLNNMQEFNKLTTLLQPGMGLVTVCRDSGDKFEKAKTVTANCAFNTLMENAGLKMALTWPIKEVPMIVFVDSKMNIVGDWVLGFPAVVQPEPTPTPAPAKKGQVVEPVEARTLANELYDMVVARLALAQELQAKANANTAPVSPEASKAPTPTTPVTPAS